MSQSPTLDPNWLQTPVFSDEFNASNRFWVEGTKTDNLGKWRAWFHDCGVVHGSFLPEISEYQIWKSEQAIFHPGTEENGYIEFEAVKDSCKDLFWKPSWNHIGPRSFFSGAIESTCAIKYGWFEIRCALPSTIFVDNIKHLRYGNFPAFWLWSKYGPNSHYNEIDIFEHVIRKVTGSNCWPRCDVENDSLRVYGTYWKDTPSGLIGIEAAQYVVDPQQSLHNYHIYAVEWGPGYAVWYYDGVQRSMVIQDIDIPTEAMYIRANLAIDGNLRALRANVDTCEILYEDIVKHSFPRSMKIDYIRVYQLRCACQQPLIISTSSQINNINTPAVMKSITINPVEFITINAGNNISLRAVESITINGDFEVSSGASLFLFTHPCPDNSNQINQ